MKQFLFMKMMLLAGLVTYSQLPNSWTRIADFPGIARFYGTVSFSIGSKGYVGTGAADDIFFTYQKDLWAYDTTTGAWTQMADFGGGSRSSAVGFSIGDKGYIGTGDNRSTVFKDFWEYDPATNAWVQKADFGGGNRDGAGGFSIGSKGYIGTGDSGGVPTKDVWEYDPANDTWTRKADFSGIARNGTFGLAIGSKGYFLGGGGFKDFWEYNPDTDTWVQKPDYAGGVVSGPAGFTLGNKGYVGTGDAITGNEVWEYDPVIETWTRKADMGGGSRENAVGFSIGNNGYIGIGFSTEYDGLNDFWKYWPSTGCAQPANLKVPEVTANAAVLRWALPADPVEEFDISYHIFNSAAILTRHRPGTSSHVVLNGLEPGTKYQWRIRSNCGSDTSNWIKGPDFKTLPATVSALSATAITMNDQVRVLSNPSNGNFVLQMQLPSKAASTTLELYNNLGLKVWQQDAGKLSGLVRRNIDLESKLTAGVYVMIIRQGNTRLIQKVVVTK